MNYVKGCNFGVSSSFLFLNTQTDRAIKNPSITQGSKAVLCGGVCVCIGTACIPFRVYLHIGNYTQRATVTLRMHSPFAKKSEYLEEELSGLSAIDFITGRGGSRN